MPPRARKSRGNGAPIATLLAVILPVPSRKARQASKMVAQSGMTSDQLHAFLSHPHGAMPNLSLTRTEIDDLISYIETLR